jgi:hypothetical protein
MARVAELAGDREGLRWLQEAFDADRKHGHTAADIAHLAWDLGKYDLALKMFRALSLMDYPTPLTHAMAFLEQARLAMILRNPGQAELWARKALQRDPHLEPAAELLAHLTARRAD